MRQETSSPYDQIPENSMTPKTKDNLVAFACFLLWIAMMIALSYVLSHARIK
jgi:hypothetical protein